ncbi:MAG: AsmA family protein [Alphaproteobacteria bacterium]|nr:AsmA family protein [Alphaproteobacteria bacterium]MBU0799309.1 AsmA family protein [Alphaproteobacteria bacterium]MBU0888177.1 AsmA family protein [Alphaproteobacteria bacterium]MBU1811622.1 AsmA family protein [Alphaproteobacteria bacterium]
MRLKTIAKIVGVGLVAIVVALAAVVYSVDEEDIRRQIAQQVEAATGRSLTIAGDIGVGLSMTPVLTAKDVRFANADWGSRTNMASIAELRVSAALLPLIEGRVEIRELDLVRPDILLETNAQGRGNWQFNAPGASGSPSGRTGGGGRAIDLGEIGIEGGTLTYRDGRTGAAQVLELATLTVKPSGATTNDIVLDATYQGIEAKLSGTVGGLSALTSGQSFPVDVTGRIAGVDIALKGTAGVAVESPLNLSVTAKTSDYEQLARLTGPLPDIGALDLQAQMSGTRQKLRLEPLALRLGDSDIAGTLSIATNGPRPVLSGTLTSDRLDFAPLLKEEPAASGGSGSADGRVIPAESLDLAVLKTLDADIAYQAARVSLRQEEMTDVSARLSLKNGDLRLDPLTLTSFGGMASHAIRVNAAASPVQISVKGSTEGLDLGRLLKETGATDQVSGTGDIALDLTGRGDTPRAIAGSLEGQIRTVMRDGTIHNRYLELLATDLVANLLTGQGGADRANLNCFVSRFDVSRGVARSRVMLVDTNRVTVVGTGTADLGREQLDLTLTPAPKDASLVSLATPILVRGSFSKPSVALDPTALATGVAGAIAGGMVNPLGLLVPFLSGGSNDSPCTKAIAGLDNPDAPAGSGSGGGSQPGGIPGLFQNLLGR